MPDVQVDLEKCEGAGVCVEVCPVQVYDLVEIGGEKKAQATRADECIMCMSCVNGCPAGAIVVEP